VGRWSAPVARAWTIAAVVVPSGMVLQPCFALAGVGTLY